ncbi:AHH domain-containing protein [Myxococcus eversor]|uniref:AHH domain-containing protein n=1 Tax=Myxococcus eversor TaxID=2709661 RepID=UPI001F07B491|nr:AHH domain-containing protein [Myxococcus eversor]
MNVPWVAVLLMLPAGCATAREVRLDVGRGEPIVYTPVESDPIELDADAFGSALTRLALELQWESAHQEAGPGRAAGPSAASSHERTCQRQGSPTRCLGLLARGFAVGPRERHMLALAFSLDPVWNEVEDALGEAVNPLVWRAMVASLVEAVLSRPEEREAIATVATLIAYLGTGPVWTLQRGFQRLQEESRDARSLEELEGAGHRFGRILGDSGTRVLVLVALSMLGGESGMATEVHALPRFARAAARAQMEGGFLLPAALLGEVQSLSLSSAGELNVRLVPTAVAAVALGSGIGVEAWPAASVVQGDPEGVVHHICADVHDVAEMAGDAWAPEFEELFAKAEMKLSAPENQVRIRGHRGPHSREYHNEIFRRVALATGGCRNPTQCRLALTDELAKIARDLVHEKSVLRKLVTNKSVSSSVQTELLDAMR